ncbi:MAG: UDP-glucose dehydrogenase family protein [Planctomycetota bacterium]|jgi:UDPglucose 6-dehydrogenase
MKLCIVGCGYAGLVTGTCLAEMGNHVLAVDKDGERIEKLRRGQTPIYERGLADLIARNLEDGRLRFTDDIGEAVDHGVAIMICVGTPPAPDGTADLSAVMEVAGAIGDRMRSYMLIVIKSTVPVGTCARVAREIAARTDADFDVAFNPEFLKEGTAVEDFFKPDRVILGADTERALSTLRMLYGPFARAGKPLIEMSAASAEMTKHAANAMLATRISFINELAALCEAAGADISEVREGMAADTRIGPQFLFPGLGFGGSCLPKDIRALAQVARSHGRPLRVCEAAHAANREARERFLEKVVAHFGGDLNGRVLAVWGLAFKPRTDDIREAPAIWMIGSVLERWPRAIVRAHDPAANASARAALAPSVELAESQYQPLEGAEALVICTDWSEFGSPDFPRMKALMKEPVIFDGRNLYEPGMMRDQGFTYYSVGRAPAVPEPPEPAN